MVNPAICRACAVVEQNGTRALLFFLYFFIVNDNIVLYINTFHTETGPLCQALRSFTNLVVEPLDSHRFK